ncbi:FAD-dependent monooxygenase [Neorhizobium alkalisoli]|uniref:2-polyprenyl-6-methoxyphenol hydroxylase-like FAD-dependent oxidoreductase n=1 Tax=Neorhizobium alkalisoli TaxID=528178 RepID=A0A561QXP2_9HYPH|nr:FAD-dependent monooxygenase [Neorhizobium alkalisoli]TWF55089.1 2-polyprenyl-6-methoxyphenol hydroxylase-like FAD-dependent oxidoreductase [Neorhizobium alkalisoli]
MRHDVLIVGAGPTGMVLALWLAKMGVSVRIISKASGPGTASRALAVHARTLEFYAQAGLAEAVVTEGFQVGGVNLWVGGERQAHVALDETGARYTRYPFLHIYPQDRHEALLAERLQAAGVTIEWNTTLVGFEETADGVIAHLTLPDGREETAEAAWVAGCDGASSTVRKVLGIGFPGGTYEQTFYVADVEAKGPPMNGELNIDLDSADFLAIFPLDAGARARLIGTVRETDAEAGQMTFEDVNRKAVESLKIEVTKVNWFSHYRVHHRVVDRFRKGRAFLLGDAAHIHSPAGGQGMNTGIGDAVNLAWKLKAVVKGEADARLLDTYEEERIAFARKLVGTTDEVFSLATSDGNLARFVRTRILPVVAPFAARIELLREWVFRTVSQLEIDYRGDFLSEGEAGRVRGGDRLPWLDLGEGRSNYDGFGDFSWHVHVYGYAGHLLEDWCRANGVPLWIFPWQTDFEDAGLARDAVYLVRPDTYVASAAHAASTEALDDYFRIKGLKLPLV